MKFQSIQELKEQLIKDKVSVRDILNRQTSQKP
jgi:FAD synthase